VEVANFPLSEEEVRVSKREVVTGRVRITTISELDEKLVHQELNRAEVSVTRVPVPHCGTRLRTSDRR
jgi:stress response protein YsnF